MTIIDENSLKLLNGFATTGGCPYKLSDTIARCMSPELGEAVLRWLLRKWECLKLCVSEPTHAVFRYSQASKRPANIMAS